MRATNFLTNNDSSHIGTWARLANALAFPVPLGKTPTRTPTPKPADRPGILERLDRWFWKQEMKEREAWLAKSQDIFELERRIRMLERFGSRYY